MAKTIVFDFDGVIHSYKSGWKDVDVIPDPPVEGIKEVIDELRTQGYEVCVFSSRVRLSTGWYAVEKWLKKHDIVVDSISAEKPPALVYVDDRAICFNGECSGFVEQIKNFKSWVEEKNE